MGIQTIKMRIHYMKGKILYISLILAILLSLSVLGIANFDSNNTNIELHELEWQEDENALGLILNGEILWQLNYSRDEDKPYFYPLRNLDGVNLVLKRPEDHPWHRGLWFSWKYINGVNYWEEDQKRGLSEGRSLIENIQIDKASDYSANIEMLIHYSPENEPVVLTESRTLFISSPNSKGTYYIDWKHTFTAKTNNVILDRTLPEKFEGPGYGGYAGLGFRANDQDLVAIEFTDSEGWVNNESLVGHGEKARWMNFNGKVRNVANKSAGLTIFDHPENPRHPTPWYIWFRREGNGSGSNYSHAFFQPAFLFNESYELNSDESFSLKYRVLIHSGDKNDYDLNRIYSRYAKSNK